MKLFGEFNKKSEKRDMQVSGQASYIADSRHMSQQHALRSLSHAIDNQQHQVIQRNHVVSLTGYNINT
jgi:hypothetical protein